MKAKLLFMNILITIAIVGCVILVDPIGRDFGKERRYRSNDQNRDYKILKRTL